MTRTARITHLFAPVTRKRCLLQLMLIVRYSYRILSEAKYLWIDSLQASKAMCSLWRKEKQSSGIVILTLLQGITSLGAVTRYLYRSISLITQTMEPQRVNWQGTWILAGRSCHLSTLIQMQQIEHPVSRLPHVIFPAFLNNDSSIGEPLLIQNIMHIDESLPPAIKTSPRESIDLTNLLEHESPAPQSKRQKLNPSNDAIASKSQMPAIPKTTLFGPSRLLPKAATAEATPFMRSNDDGSRAREPHQAPSSTSVHKSPTLNNEYVMTHVEVQFVSPNGSVARTKPLKACDSLTRLLSHGKLAFGRLSTSGMILIIRIPGLESSTIIVDGDTDEFNDFMQLLSDVARGYLDPEDREILRIEVSEMSNEP